MKFKKKICNILKTISLKNTDRYYNVYFFTQVGIINGGGNSNNRVLSVTNGPETAASLLAAGLDARAAELVSLPVF